MKKEGQISPIWKHPPHCDKWNDDLIEKACTIISNNPILTLEEIIQTMTSKKNAPQIEPTILNSDLAFSLKTLKDGAFHAMARDSNEKIE